MDVTNDQRGEMQWREGRAPLFAKNAKNGAPPSGKKGTMSRRRQMWATRRTGSGEQVAGYRFASEEGQPGKQHAASDAESRRARFGSSQSGIARLIRISSGGGEGGRTELEGLKTIGCGEHLNHVGALT